MSKQIHVGAVAVGGGAPVSIQSMCNTPTQDVERTVSQILRLEQAGCQIIRVAVPDTLGIPEGYLSECSGSQPGVCFPV